MMVDNAGMASESSLETMSIEEWRRVIDTDLGGPMHGSKAALAHRLESEGCANNIESTYGLGGGKGGTAYSAAKGGVVNFTQQVAVDHAEHGVRVNGIRPGGGWTPLIEELLEQVGSPSTSDNARR